MENLARQFELFPEKPAWIDIFTLTDHQKSRKVDGWGSKTSAADIKTWRGWIQGQKVEVRSYPRLINALASFLTPSNARLRTGYQEKWGGHFVDIEILKPSQPGASLESFIAELAKQSDTRPVRVRKKGAPVRD
jgi:hypothetical protein